MLRDYWYIACQSAALAKKPVAFTAFGLPLVAFRDGNGKAGVLIDKCAHRNAPLSAGKICDGHLQCPYHGWSYDTRGQVQLIPACATGSEAAAASRSLKIDAYECIEQDDYVWFSLSPSPATERPLNFAHKNDPGWTSFTMDTLFEGPVDTCLENFLDCPHATFVHRYWFRKPTSKPVAAVVSTTADGAQAEYFDEPREGSVVWSLLSRSKSTMSHTDRFIAPATSRVDYRFSDKRHYIITSSCTPIDENTTRVHTVISFRFGKIGWLVKLFFKPLSQRIIKQDVEMVRMQQQNIRRFGKKRYQIIEQDLLYKHIVQWRSQLEKNNQPPPSTDVQKVNILI